MANITKAGAQAPSMIQLPPHCRISEKAKAGEAIALLDPVVLRSDGKWYKSNGTSADGNAQCNGFSLDDAANVDDPITVGHSFSAQYSSAGTLTPGASYYVATTAGILSDTATTGGTKRVAFALDAYRIYVLPPN